MTATEPIGPSLADIRHTREQNRPYILQTPVHGWRGREMQARIGSTTDVQLKLELFQHSGTFKARGAVTTVRELPAEARARGVTAVSAGNHAVAVAYAAQCFGTSAKVVMRASANPARVAACRAYGAEVILVPAGTDAFGLAQDIAREEGRTFVHPFEGRQIALGTATLGLELCEQAPVLDAVIVAIGGGGLCAGVATAVKAMQPHCRVYGVEPVGADTMHRSFAASAPASRSDVATIADSLAPPHAAPYSYSLCRAHVDGLVRVTDQEMLDAMALLFREMKLAVEPAGAAATAALLGPLRERLSGQRVGVIVCGANIDIATFAAHVGRADQDLE